MELKDVELLRAVCDAGSLSNACHRLAISQPTLSKRLARLESLLGVTLFQRYSTGLEPTPVTEYILQRAAPLRTQLTEIERQVALMSDLQLGEIRLGVSPTVEYMLLPPVLQQFVSSTGSVSLNIVTEDNAASSLAMFGSSCLDVIVGPFFAADHESERVMAQQLFTNTIIAVARPEHPCFLPGGASPDRLSEYSWAIPANPQGTSLERPLPEFMSGVKVFSDSYDTLNRLTQENDILCAGPSGLFAEGLASGSLQTLAIDLGLTMTFSLLVRREAYATPLMHHLVDLFVTEAAKLH